MMLLALPTFLLLASLAAVYGEEVDLSPLCNGNKTVHCVYSPQTAVLSTPPSLNMVSGSLLRSSTDRIGVRTWVVENSCATNLEFRCGNDDHPQVWRIAFKAGGGTVFGPKTPGHGYVYFNDDGKKATQNKDLDSSTPGVDVTAGCD